MNNTDWSITNMIGEAQTCCYSDLRRTGNARYCTYCINGSTIRTINFFRCNRKQEIMLHTQTQVNDTAVKDWSSKTGTYSTYKTVSSLFKVQQMQRKIWNPHELCSFMTLKCTSSHEILGVVFFIIELKPRTRSGMS